MKGIKPYERCIGGICQCRSSSLQSVACSRRQMKSFEAGAICLESLEFKCVDIFGGGGWVVEGGRIHSSCILFYPNVESK